MSRSRFEDVFHAVHPSRQGPSVPDARFCSTGILNEPLLIVVVNICGCQDLNQPDAARKYLTVSV